jgi:hypothetical protein
MGTANSENFGISTFHGRQTVSEVSSGLAQLTTEHSRSGNPFWAVSTARFAFRGGEQDRQTLSDSRRS